MQSTSPHTSQWPMLGALSLALAAWPSVGLASGAAAPQESMVLLLTILASIGGAYLLTHFIVDRLQRKLLFVSGVEYILLGVLLGASSGVLSDVDSLAPVVAVGTGWIGLLQGVGLSGQRIRTLPRWAGRLALVELVVVGGGVGLGGWLMLTLGLGAEPADAHLPAAILGLAAAAGSTTSTGLLGRRFPQLAESGDTLALLDGVARLTQTFAILAFGVLLCIFHPDVPGMDPSPVAAEWLLLMLGLGVVLGGLFRLLVSAESTENHRFMAMVGIICFATGAAFFLDLSALAVNLVLGVVLAQGARGPELHQTLTRTLGPVVLMLLLLAGVLWQPVPWVSGVVLALSIVALRAGLKLLSGMLSAAGTPLRGDLGRGTMSQGAVSVAIALSCRLVYDGPLVDLVFTAILVSVVIAEAAGPRLLKGLLVDAGELRQDLDLSPQEA